MHKGLLKEPEPVTSLNPVSPESLAGRLQKGSVVTGQYRALAAGLHLGETKSDWSHLGDSVHTLLLFPGLEPLVRSYLKSKSYQLRKLLPPPNLAVCFWLLPSFTYCHSDDNLGREAGDNWGLLRFPSSMFMASSLE
jgi:hypothetical protein